MQNLAISDIFVARCVAINLNYGKSRFVEVGRRTFLELLFWVEPRMADWAQVFHAHFFDCLYRWFADLASESHLVRAGWDEVIFPIHFGCVVIEGR